MSVIFPNNKNEPILEFIYQVVRHESVKNKKRVLLMYNIKSKNP